MILTRDKNRSKVKLQKIDLGKNQTIVVDANNKTKMNDVSVTSLQSTISDIGMGACTSLTSSGNISTTDNVTAMGTVQGATVVSEGNFSTLNGNISTFSGDISTQSGDVYTSQGNISTANGSCNVKGLSISGYDPSTLQVNRWRVNTLLSVNDIRQVSAGVITIQDSGGTSRIKLDSGSGFNGIAYMGTGTGAGNYIRFRYNDSSHLYIYSDGTLYYDLISNQSDDRIKTNESIITPEAGLEIVNKLRPQIYDKRSRIDQVPTPENTIRESGFIAQQIYYEVHELRHCVNIPEDAEPVEGVVIDHNDPSQDLDYTSLGWGTTTASLNHNMFLPYLVASIQKLSAEVDLLKSQLNNI